MKKFLLLLVGFVFTLPAISQVKVGDGNYSANLPVHAYYGYTYSQTIYLASDINTSGDIDSVSYYINPNTNLSSSSQWVVLIGHIAQDGFSGSWLDVNNMDTVFDGAITVINDTINIPFDAPFSYNGVDNIVITVLENQAGYNGSSDRFIGTQAVGNFTSRYVSQDSEAYNPYTFTGTGFQVPYFPNITFHGIVQSCPNLSGFSLDSISDLSAGVSWTSNGGSEFEVDFGLNSLALGGGAISTITTDSIFIDTLTPLTAYRIYAREICGPGDTSSWAGPLSFTTLCPSSNSPDFSEDFTSFPPSCWEVKKGLISDSTTFENGYPAWTSDGFANNGYSGSARINLYSNIRDWFISPTIDLGSGSTLYQLSFDAALTPYSGGGTAEFGSDDSVFVLISTDNGLTWSDNNKLKEWYAGVSLSSSGDYYAIDLSAYTGLVKFAFYAFSPTVNNDIKFYIDNFLIDEKPACSQPLDLSVSSITDVSAVLSWLDTDSAYAVEYGLAGFVQDITGQNIIDINNDSLLINGLTPNTGYDFYVRTYCSVGDTSSWTGPYGFMTLCESLSVPTSLETFDAIAPICWTEARGILSDSTLLTVENSNWSSSFYGNNSSNSLGARINVYSSRKEWLISQSINLDSSQNYQLEFDVVSTSYLSTGVPSVGIDDTVRVLISVDNGVSWNHQGVLDTWTAASGFSNTTHRKVYDLSTYSGVVKFAFYVKSDLSSGGDFDFFIDNFMVNTCTQYFSVVDTSCFSYTSPYSGTVFTQSGTYIDSLSNTTCDSFVTLDVTINPHTPSFFNVIECDTFISVTGNAYTQTGVYFDTIPNMYACDSVIETNLSVLYVDLSIDQNQNVFMSSNESDPAATYQWINCSDLSPISGETSMDFIATALGDYACKVTIGNCTQVSECISVTSLDTNTTSIYQFEKSDVDVYPNPNDGYFSINLNKLPDDLQLSISNTLGQVVYSQAVDDFKVDINLRDIERGVYILNLKNDNLSFNKRILLK